jgi:hypothetical protein
MLSTDRRETHLEAHAVDLVRQALHAVRELSRVCDRGVRPFLTRRCMPAYALGYECRNDVLWEGGRLTVVHDDI